MNHHQHYPPPAVVCTDLFLSPPFINSSLLWTVQSNEKLLLLRSIVFFFGIAADPGYPAVPSLKSLNFNVLCDEYTKTTTNRKYQKKSERTSSSFGQHFSDVLLSGDGLEIRHAVTHWWRSPFHTLRPIRLAYMSHFPPKIVKKLSLKPTHENLLFLFFQSERNK